MICDMMIIMSESLTKNGKKIYKHISGSELIHRHNNAYQLSTAKPY